MDEGAGISNDFRYYNYRKVPYMGGSDEFKYEKNLPLCITLLLKYNVIFRYMKHKPFRRSSNGIGNGGRCV